MDALGIHAFDAPPVRDLADTRPAPVYPLVSRHFELKPDGDCFRNSLWDPSGHSLETETRAPHAALRPTGSLPRRLADILLS